MMRLKTTSMSSKGDYEMKKIFFTIVFVLLLLSLVGCSDSYTKYYTEEWTLKVTYATQYRYDVEYNGATIKSIKIGEGGILIITFTTDKIIVYHDYISFEWIR